MTKPSNNEFNSYFQPYIDLVSDEDYFENLTKNTTDILTHFEGIPLEKHNYAYEENKWSIKQVLMHIIDTERIFAYRLLVIIRKDVATKLQSYDDDLYASNVNVDNRQMSSLLEEFQVVRKNTEFILKNVDEDQSQLTGKVNDNIFSVRAIAYLLLGHAKHHSNVIHERY
jgi:hypothetical protein